MARRRCRVLPIRLKKLVWAETRENAGAGWGDREVPRGPRQWDNEGNPDPWNEEND